MGDDEPTTMSNPNEWLGLLRWSLAYTDGTNPTAAKEMDAERRKWLETAMSEMIVDEAKRMKEIVEQLAEMSSSQEEHGDVPQGLFDELEDMVDSLDAAWDLIKMGSMHTVIAMLRSGKPIFRVGASQIVATVAQNNPKCQESLLKLGALAYTTHMSVHDADPTVQLKALSAVSCLVRNCQLGERDFVDNGDGLLALANGLQSDQARFVAKCVHMLSFFLTEDEGMRDVQTLSRHRKILIDSGAAGLGEPLIGHEEINVRLGSLEMLSKLGDVSEELKQKCATRLTELGEMTPEAQDQNQDEIILLKELVQQSD